MISNWAPTRPKQSPLLDHDVEVLGHYLNGKRIALMVCGGIAAMKAPLLARALRRYGAEVTVYVSKEALRYSTVDALEWSSNNPVVTHLSARSEHLSKENPFDIFLVAPATYNTINKVRHGIADTLISTTLAPAFRNLADGKCQIMMAPTMHGDFHNSIFQESVEHLSELGVLFIPPRDAYGKHNIPDLKSITAFVCHHSSQSPLKGKNVLITAGSIPTYVDSVRYISNHFRGRLGIEMSNHLCLMGANVKLLRGAGSFEPGEWIDSTPIRDFDHYEEEVVKTLDLNSFDFGIFSAAVADYQSAERFNGKLPSGGALESISLKPTKKIIELVKEKFPNLPLISFKLESGITQESLFEIAHSRIEKGHFAVIANRSEDLQSSGEHLAYLFSRSSEQPEVMKSKKDIAIHLGHFLENSLL